MLYAVFGTTIILSLLWFNYETIFNFIRDDKVIFINREVNTLNPVKKINKSTQTSLTPIIIEEEIESLTTTEEFVITN